MNEPVYRVFKAYLPDSESLLGNLAPLLAHSATNRRAAAHLVAVPLAEWENVLSIAYLLATTEWRPTLIAMMNAYDEAQEATE